jgi:hypothetical protein
LDARLKTLLRLKNIVAKSKEVKTRCNLAESSTEGYSFKKGKSCFANDDDDDDDDDSIMN